MPTINDNANLYVYYYIIKNANFITIKQITNLKVFQVTKKVYKQNTYRPIEVAPPVGKREQKQLNIVFDEVFSTKQGALGAICNCEAKRLCDLSGRES